MNKCFLLTKKNAVDIYSLKEIAQNYNIEIIPVVSELSMLKASYYEKCPILVDDEKCYNEMLDTLSLGFCKDIYLLKEGNVYKDQKVMTLKQFFESDIFNRLKKRYSRSECKKIVEEYFCNKVENDWRLTYIVGVVLEMYYLEKQSPDEKLLEYILKKDRFIKDDFDSVKETIKKVLENKIDKNNLNNQTLNQLFTLLYKDIFNC